MKKRDLSKQLREISRKDAMNALRNNPQHLKKADIRVNASEGQSLTQSTKWMHRDQTTFSRILKAIRPQ